MSYAENQEGQRLFELLPMELRIRDVHQDDALGQLASVLGEQIALLQEDMDQLYDDQFIETCAEWVAPYIGDLIGYRSLHGKTERTRSARAEVANTIAYRRRKGTASVLEQLARDVTGWHARAVELFQQIIVSQYMKHIRLHNAATPDMRRWQPLERLGSAFNRLNHTVEMRHVSTQGGRYNVPNIGLFLWRLDAWSLSRSPAVRVDNRRYLFSPLGNNTQLVNYPMTERNISHIAEPINVPEPLSRRVLDANPEHYYGNAVGPASGNDVRKSLFLEVNGVDTSLANIDICNLSDDGGGNWAYQPNNRIAIDPVLGRIAFPNPQPANRLVLVSYHYGFSAAMGGGEYERQDSFRVHTAPDQVLVQGDALQPALAAVAGGGLVEISDSGRYSGTPVIASNAGALIEWRAANDHRPTIVLGGELQITIDAGAELVLNGLLISGAGLRVTAHATAGTRSLRLRHCSLVPGLTLSRNGEPENPQAPSLIIEQPNLNVIIEDSIVGGIRSVSEATLEIRDSIVDATDKTGVAYAAANNMDHGGTLRAINTSFIGKVHARRMPMISNSIFYAELGQADPWQVPVRSEQRQNGCVRYTYVPDGSIVPRHHQCQPQRAIAEAIDAAEKQQPGSLNQAQKDAIAAEVRARINPAFNSLRYGQADYAQLRLTPEEIRRGADDEAEMGAFHDLYAPQREDDLRIRLDEYLRFGLEAGIFYAN